MKTIKIMIAASEEMHEEKLEFSNLIEHLNKVLEPRGIELKRVKWNPETDGSIEEYKTKLDDCEICLTLYWRELAGNSEQELNTAYKELKDGNNPRNLYVFFKEPAEDLTTALKNFKASFVTNYGHFFCKFENVDTMSLHFILQLEAYQNSKTDSLVSVSKGKVKVAGEELVNLDNIPFASMNRQYQRLRDELRREEVLVEDLKAQFQRNISDDNFQEKLTEETNKMNKLAEEFDLCQNHLYNIALSFAKKSHEYFSERLLFARDQFEKGNIEEANKLLNLKQLKTETELELHHYEQNLRNLELKIIEFQSKIRFIKALEVTCRRISDAIESYKQAIQIARIINYDKFELAQLIFNLAQYIDENTNDLSRMFEWMMDVEDEGEAFIPVSVGWLKSICGYSQDEITNDDYQLFSDGLLDDEDFVAKRNDYLYKMYQEAINVFRTFSSASPDNALPLLANSIIRISNLQVHSDSICSHHEALEIYRKLCTDTNNRYWLNIIEVLCWLAENDESSDTIKSYDEVMKIVHHFSDVSMDEVTSLVDYLIKAAKAFFNLQLNEKGEEACEIILSLQKDDKMQNVKIRESVESLYEEFGLLDKAAQMVREDFENDPYPCRYTLAHLAEIHKKQNDYERALSDYQICVDILEEECQSWMRMNAARKCNKEGDKASDEDYYNSERKELYYNMAESFYCLGQYSSAKQECLKILEISQLSAKINNDSRKLYPQTLSMLAEIQLKDKLPQEAFKIYEDIFTYYANEILYDSGNRLYSRLWVKDIGRALHKARKLFDSTSYGKLCNFIDDKLVARIEKTEDKSPSLFIIDMWLKLGDNDKVEKWREICSQFLVENPNDSLFVAGQIYNNGVENALGNSFDVAIREFRESLELIQKYGDKEDLDWLRLRNNAEQELLEALTKNVSPDTAIEYSQEIRTILNDYEESAIKNNWIYFLFIARILSCAKKMSESRDAYKEAIDLGIQLQIDPQKIDEAKKEYYSVLNKYIIQYKKQRDVSVSDLIELIILADEVDKLPKCFCGRIAFIIRKTYRRILLKILN